ncbi:hypothetical protein PsorP6_001149 [Peronosclerospora sorghi]|uniref:Uncharacterized protein n=1 Tax=Peronosclerospora sorghi TaxID=230839 RepID=A0ACC0WRS8_9STRA|nr:hypothetical protein PsorP6_001149 [Peronosclerospora sorghi]
MPLTRKRARMMESQDEGVEEDLDEEPVQSVQETQDEHDQQASGQMEAPEVVNLREMAKQYRSVLPERKSKAFTQLTDTLKHLMTTHRWVLVIFSSTYVVIQACSALYSQLEDDAITIQTGMDELYRMQENVSWFSLDAVPPVGFLFRAQRIVGRLKNASSTILTFGDTSQEAHEGERPENEVEENEDEVR